jgi:ABC-2 type transport system ATP-binding protein
MSDAAPVLRLEGVTVRYGSFVAVDGLDFELGRGELFGLLGPNGAGKSTTLKVLVGQLGPSTGRVAAFGLDLQRDWQRIKPRFGYVPDRDNHFEELSGRRNLVLFAELYAVDEARVDDALARMELTDAAALPVRAYSQGMRRKLLLARALLHRPELVYLDEPTANLDVHSTRVVHEVLRELARGGCSILLTTHDMEEVEALCDRVLVLRRGRSVALGTPAELRRDHARRLVDVLATDGSRHVFDLDIEPEREALASMVASGDVSSLRSRSADLRAAFLELTEQE